MMLLPIVNSREFAVVDDADGKKCDRYKWRCLPTGYVYASISVGPRSTKFLYLHHFILGPIPKGREVDHINGDRLDNRRSNLRIASHHINQVNRHRHNSRNTS